MSLENDEQILLAVATNKNVSSDTLLSMFASKSVSSKVKTKLAENPAVDEKLTMTILSSDEYNAVSKVILNKSISNAFFQKMLTDERISSYVKSLIRQDKRLAK